MKNSLIAIALLTASLVGCNKSSDESKPAPEDQRKTLKVVTDTSVCGHGPAARGLDGTWVSNQISLDGKFSLQMRFAFEGQRLTLSNTCSMGGRSLVASVTVPVSTAGNEVRVLREGHDSEKIDEPGFNLECNVAASAGSMPYQLSGACLKFVDPKSNQELVLVPANADSPAPENPSEPLPAPRPQPPQPQPFPLPAPQPQPEPQPVDGWACLERNSLTDQAFIGFGPTVEIAKSAVKQLCRGAQSSHYCKDEEIDCSEREGYRESWFCELKNTLTNEVFNGKGLSRVEATYAAEATCFAGQSVHYCESGAAVNCSRF